VCDFYYVEGKFVVFHLQPLSLLLQQPSSIAGIEEMLDPAIEVIE
jgi:hypothetical protein